MSNERKHPDRLEDPIVSQAYRELSNERAPEHLDHVVLNEARSSAKPRLRKAMFWFRPAAWITTVGLCLAIVLEIADLPVEEAVEAPSKNEDTLTRKSEDPAAALPSESKSGLVQQAERLEPEPSTELREQQPRSELGRVSMDAASPETMPAAAPARPAGRQDGPAAIETDALKDSDMQFLREAESRARMQAGSDEGAEEIAVRELATYGIASAVKPERHCDPSETADPDDWLACIEDLERQGLPEAARLERELLAEAFPDKLAPDQPAPRSGQTD